MSTKHKFNAIKNILNIKSNWMFNALYIPIFDIY